ncbi:MAG: DUF4954 family protein [Paludibacteraceae bacterium]|nr:DUF4954 family protein [Paludibacteraceae bacterium]
MDKVTLLPAPQLFDSFLDSSYIPEGQDKYTLRNRQVTPPDGGWRHLRSDEIERLVKNQNTAMSWDNIMVSDPFDPNMVKNNEFYGMVRIGRVTADGLQFHDLKLPCGITNSSIHSCDIGNDCAIHDVHYLSHYIIGDRCMLFNVQEMSCTDHAKFGNGIIKDGEDEHVRVWMEIMNETGSRRVMPFDGMLAADAYMWAKFIDDEPLQQRLAAITQASMDSRRGYYGTVGQGVVIKNSWILKDVKIGDCCYIKGASKLKNITINSSEGEPTQIGENVVLVNGIVGYGCRIFYSCIAVKFVLGCHSNLKYGARLIDSYMGDNSTISCCEVLNNLIFPAHEQHHNNSFLIASLVKGQSNLAAGATIGSNHNSRANDNEIEAGRGFWPGLCTSVKHSCKFASFTMLAKADYPSEMNIPLPFSLVSNDAKTNELVVMPAYWWLYNMYAMARNNWKFQTRDSRRQKLQNIEFDAYAPDSMEEALNALKLLEVWTAKAMLRQHGGQAEMDYRQLRNYGHKLLLGDRGVVDDLDVLGEQMEKSHRRVRIRHVYEAYHAYRDMLVYYAVRNMMQYLTQHPDATFVSMSAELDGVRQREWLNFGGQLMMMDDVDSLRQDIRDGVLDTWAKIHERYNQIWQHYPIDKLRHAYLTLKFVIGTDVINSDQWQRVLDEALRIQHYICEQVRETRRKDYDNIFRRATYRNEEEFRAAHGELDDNSFIRQIGRETEDFCNQINQLRKRIG